MSKNISNLNKSLKDTLDLSNYSEEGHKHDDIYAPISHAPHLTLGTSSSNAFRGDYGNVAYNHSQAAHAPSNAQKNSDITKTEIEAKLTGDITSHTHSIYATKEEFDELFQNVDSGKNLIANAIDDNGITKDSTYLAMSEAVSVIKNLYKKEALKKLLQKEGYAVTDSMSINDMILTLPDPEDMDSSLSEEEKIIFKLYDLLVSYKYEVTESMNKDQMLDFIIKDALSNWVGTLKKVVKDSKFLATSSGSVYIIKNDGTLWACGFNEKGQLGLGNNSSKRTLTQAASNVKGVYCNSNGEHTFIIKNDGTVWSCGNNNYGQLGLGDKTNRNTFTQVTNISGSVKNIFVGEYHTAILKKDKTLWACGQNIYGELGIGNKTSQSTFVQVKNVSNIKEASYSDCSCHIITEDGALWGCGDNTISQLGISKDTVSSCSSPIAIMSSNVKTSCIGMFGSIIVTKDKKAYASGFNEAYILGTGVYDESCVKKELPELANLNIKKIAFGYEFCVVLTEEGDMYMAGTAQDFDFPYIPDDYINGAMPVNEDKSVQPRVGVPTHGFTCDVFCRSTGFVKDISPGSYFLYIVAADDSIWRCGYGGSGQMADGSSSDTIYLTELNFER